MHKLNPIVRKELERRGIEFAPLLNSDNWSKLAPSIPAQTALDVEGMYRDFNGFSHPDHKSQIKLWTMQDIINKNKEFVMKKNFAPCVAIGDVMIESNYIFYDTKLSLIFIDGYDDGNFESISDMLEYLAKGHFDVI